MEVWRPKSAKKGGWEFRYYETDGRSERQRRVIIVGPLEEYPTESAARKAPAVQAILLRLNAEQPAVAAGAAEVGAVIARYEKEEMPERYSTRAAYKSTSRITFCHAGQTPPRALYARWRSRTG
jgi:hypothetical protein